MSLTYAQVSPEQLGQNLVVVIVFWAVVVLLVVLLVASITWLKVAAWKRRVRRAAWQHHQAHHDAEGQPLPPMAAGLCDVCGHAFPRVYHLSDGRRLCTNCYASAPGTPGNTETPGTPGIPGIPGTQE